MARKKKQGVNTKFAVILGASIVALCGAVVGGAYLVLSKSAADSHNEAAAALAAGDIEKALGFAGRAVSKEPNNLEHLRYWVSIMERTQPITQQAYGDRYFTMLVPARQRIADLLRTDVAAHETILAPQHRLLILSRAQPKDWTDFIANVKRATDKFNDSDPAQAKGKAILNRYRGLARVELMKARFDMPEAEKLEARADLEAALKADPASDQTLVALADWLRTRAAEMAAVNRRDDMDALLKDLRTIIADFRAANPNAPGAMLVQTQVQMMDIFERSSKRAAETGQPVSGAQLEAEVQPLADEALKVAERADPRAYNAVALSNIAQIALACNLPNAYERAQALWRTIAELDATNPEPRFQLGGLAMTARKYEDAIAAMGAVADMKDLPLGINGLLLFELRRAAREAQTVAAIEMAESMPPDQREAGIKRAESLRDVYAKEARTGDLQLVLLNGRIAYLKGDYTSARQQLGMYVEQTGRSNVEAMVMLAQVMHRQGAMGAARDLLSRVTELSPSAVGAWRLLAEVQLRLPDYPGALRSITRAEALEPANEDLRKQKRLIEQLVAGVKADDPIMRAMAEAQAKLDAVPPDLEGARVLLKKAAEKPVGQPTQITALSKALYLVGEADQARAIITDALAKEPENREFKAQQQWLTDVSRPRDDIPKNIAESSLSPFEKAMALNVYYTNIGMKKEADEAFAEAKRLDPEHALVLSREFENALAEKRFDDARRLIAKAKQTNADRAGGAIFEARFEAVQGRLPIAIDIVRRAAEADPLNPVTWRLLGQLSLTAGKFGDAASAMERAVNIKPDDAESVYGLARAKLAVGAPMDALKVCRGAQMQAARSPELMNLWLELEMQMGDVNLAMDKRKRMFEALPKDRVNGAAYLRLLLAEKNFEEAAKVIETAKREGWDQSINPLRALYWASQGKKAEARAIFDELIKTVPADQRSTEQDVAFARAMADLGAVDLAVEILTDARPLQAKDRMEVDREIGDIYFTRGMYKEAIEVYQRALDSVAEDKNNLLAQRIAEGCIRIGQPERATAVLEKAVPKGDEERMRLLMLRAEVLTTQKKYVEARPLLDDAVAAGKDNWLPYFKRGECNYRDPALFKDAMADLEQALRLNPDAIPARLLLAGLHVVDNQPDRGIALLRDGLAQDPGNEELRMSLITGLVRLGKARDALVLAEEAYEKSQQLRWAGMAADLYAQARSWNNAARYYSELWKRDPQPSVAVRYLQALMNASPSDIATAKAVLATPGLGVDENPIFRMLRAWVAMRDNRPKDAEMDALAAWSKINVDDMKEVEGFMSNLLQMYSKPSDTTSRFEEAVNFARQQLVKARTSDVAEYQIARFAFADAKLRPGASTEINRLLKEAKTPAVIVACAKHLGNEAYAAKEYQRAADIYRKGISADPNDADLLNNAGYCLSKNLNKPEEGLPLVKQAVALRPNDPNMLDSLGAVYMMADRLEEAEATLKQARAASPNPFEAAAPTIHLIEVKLKKNDRSAADQLMRELRSLIEREPQPKRIEQVYRDDIDRVQKALTGGGS